MLMVFTFIYGSLDYECTLFRVQADKQMHS